MADIPKISPWLWRGFAWYGRRYVSRHFHAVRISRAQMPLQIDPQLPLIIYLNHPSWWDPMTCLLLASSLFPNRRHYAPIDAVMLKRYRFFARLGFFGIEQDSRRGAASFLRKGRAICAQPDAALWITPQGQFTDARVRPTKLRPGLSHLAKYVPDATVLPMALEYSFWDERLPEALVRFGPAFTIRSKEQPVLDLNHSLETSLTAAQDALAIEAQTRDPGRFEPLIRGRAGVGGTYGMWRRLRARMSGQKFVPEHGGVRA